MAHYRTSPIARASRQLAGLRYSLGLTMAFAALVGLTGAAHAPAGDTALTLVAAAPAATLERSGDALLITGSVGDIFFSDGFVGTNKADKQDRARPVVDVAEIAESFDSIRARIAALRTPKPAAAPESTAVAAVTALAAPATAEAGPTVSVAALSPELASEALDAIDQLASDVPVPRSMPQTLAYARADLPATVFDGSISDKKGKRYSEKELWCMATGIYFEARGESYRGQIAVAQVVMNRVAHKLYPETICGVVFQNQHKRNACQFSFACDGIPEVINDQKSWKQAMKIAQDVVAGHEYLSEVGASTHYHATYVYPHWAPRMNKVTKIGLHIFYEFKRGWKFG